MTGAVDCAKGPAGSFVRSLVLNKRVLLSKTSEDSHGAFAFNRAENGFELVLQFAKRCKLLQNRQNSDCAGDACLEFLSISGMQQLVGREMSPKSVQSARKSASLTIVKQNKRQGSARLCVSVSFNVNRGANGITNM